MLLLAPILAAGQAFTCTPVRVWDGDGPVWCAEGPRLRLAGIAAREMDGSCRPNQPCPAASAEAARDGLVRLLGRAVGRSPEGHVLVDALPMRCVSTGNAGGDRTGAWCVTARGADLSCAMVASGYALRWDRYWDRHRCP
jgi:endonuclease YncB( thermonuclease family)